MVSTCEPQHPDGTQAGSTAPVVVLSRATPLRLTAGLFTLRRQPPTYTWFAPSTASDQTGCRLAPDFMLPSNAVTAPFVSEKAASPLRVTVVCPCAVSKMPPTKTVEPEIAIV